MALRPTPGADGAPRAAATHAARPIRSLGEVPCFDAGDARVAERIRARLPVVMRRSRLAAPAVERWRVPYLKRHITSSAPFTVFASRTNFLYCDPEKNQGRWAFTPRIRKVEVPFTTFADEFQRRCAANNSKHAAPGAPASASTSAAPAAGASAGAGGGAAEPGGSAGAEAEASAVDVPGAAAPDAGAGAHRLDDGSRAPARDAGAAPQRSSDTRIAESGELIYLQQSLFAGIGDQILADFKQFAFDEAAKWSTACSWGPLTTNLLLIGETGCITPFHYDEQQNLFAQVEGRKRVLLAPPGDFHCMYPFPVGHPADRQSQVDFYNPDFKRFPRYPEARISSVLLEPGDVLYLPMYWWHQMESNLEPTVSVTFWFTAGKTPTPEPPITDDCALQAMRRNIEKLMGASPSFQASAALLAKLDRGDTPTSRDELQALAAVVKLLTMALGSAERAEAFLDTLVAGRFGHLGHLPPAS